MIDVEAWLIEREKEAIDEWGWYSLRAEFWAFLLDGHTWLLDRTTPLAWWEIVRYGSPPPSWSQLRKAGHTRFSKIS